MNMPKYPIYLEMSGRRAVVIGAGAVALRKVQALSEAGGRVTVVAEHINPSLEQGFALPNVEMVISSYSKDFLVGATLAIAATNEPALNRQIYADCQSLEVLCNVVDQPDLCDFYVPAVLRRGDLQIAVGTDGHCPAYAGHLRKKLEEMFSETHGAFLSELEKARKQIIEKIPDTNQRKVLLGSLAGDESYEYFAAHGAQDWNRQYLAQIQDRSQPDS